MLEKCERKFYKKSITAKTTHTWKVKRNFVNGSSVQISLFSFPEIDEFKFHTFVE